MMNEEKGRLILVTGGARSGKSTFAEKVASESAEKVIYIATATADDDEMKDRIKKHRLQRPSEFITREEPFNPLRVVEAEGNPDTFILLDCLTLLMTNLLLQDENGLVAEENYELRAEEVLKYISSLAAAMEKSPADVLVVTNEVGLGLVPPYPMGRVFRDLAGRANQVFGSRADQLWLVVCGVPQQLK